MRKHHLFVLAIALGVVTGCNSGTSSGNKAEETQNASNRDTQNSKGADFLKEAADGGMMEVELGRMAKEKASMQDVKDFGQRMVTDHSKANQELKALASKKNISLPSTMSDKAQRDMDKLSEMSGQEFDQEYMDMMVKDHKKDVSAFEKAADNVDDPDIKNFASKTLPVLKDHQQLAENINQRMQNK